MEQSVDFIRVIFGSNLCSHWLSLRKKLAIFIEQHDRIFKGDKDQFYGIHKEVALIGLSLSSGKYKNMEQKIPDSFTWINEL
jgi:hypothetical protein